MATHISASPGTEGQIPLGKRLLERLKWRRRMGAVESLQTVLDLPTGERILVRSVGSEDLIYITGGLATFFGLYSIIKPVVIVYHYLVAFDDEGNERWRLAFDSYDANTGFGRTLLGCSASGDKVLIKESDPTTLWIKEVTNGVVTNTAEFDLSGAGYNDTFISAMRVSTDGTRAIFAGDILSSSPEEVVFFIYDKDTDPQIQAIEVTLDDAISLSGTSSITVVGSSDLTTAYPTFQRFTVTTAGTQPPISITRVVKTAAAEEGDPPTNVVDEVAIDTVSSSSHYIVVNEVACATDGELVVGYTTLTPPEFVDARDLVFYVHAGGSSIEVGSLAASTITVESLEGGPRVFSVTPEAASFAYKVFTGFGVMSYGYVLNGAATAVAEDVLAVDPTGVLVLADGSKYVVRRAEGDFELVDDTPYDSGRTLHSFDADGSIYTDFTSLIQPSAGINSVRKWVAETDPDTGDVTGYPTMQEIGDTPLSITATPVDPEVEETLNGGGDLTVYVQRVIG